MHRRLRGRIGLTAKIDAVFHLHLFPGRGRTAASSDLGASTLHAFFDQKVDAIRDATSGADPPTYTPAPADCDFSSLGTVTEADVIAAIKRLPAKQCATDLLPTWLFKLCASELSPFLSLLFSRSFADGAVPQSHKAAYVTPLLKKANLDPVDARSYRPVSNLSVVSKLLERIVARRLLSYLTSPGLMPSLQSAYRVNHSTETAVVYSEFLPTFYWRWIAATLPPW